MEFPSTWEVGALGSLFDTITGSTPPKSQKDNYGDDVPFVKPPELLDCEIGDTGDNLSMKGASASRTVPPGSILISCIGNLGKVGITEDTVAFNQQINAIKHKGNFVPKFVFYQALSPWFKRQLESLASGTTVPIVNKSKFNSVQVGLPPIPEQKRIVAILDQAFADIDKARALTEQNLKNARELFESYLQQVFSQRGEGWVNSTLGETCTFQGGSQPPKSEFSAKKEPGYIRLIQIRDYKSDKHVVYIPKEKAKRFCTSDDVMIGRYGPPLFQILRGIEGAYNVALMKALPNEDLISKDFLFFFLKNRDILQYIINASSRAAGQIGLNKATLEPYPISYPPLKVQAEIVAKMEAVRDKAANLEKIYEDKLDKLNELKRSLLQKAFSGELTSGNKEAAA